jgi:hypothetical protein
MGIEHKNQQSAGNQDECEYHRLRIGEMTVVPLL